MLDLIVRGGQVVTPDVVATLDIGIEDGPWGGKMPSGLRSGTHCAG